MMAEVLGKHDGYCKGKGGSMHIAAPDLGILGANGVVGAGIPISVGAGLTVKLTNSDRIVLCYFGDSASNIGAFHEALNLASLWEVPVVYICENNIYGISVAQWRHQKIKDIADRASAYTMPGEVVDGNDVEAVYHVTKKYVDAARAGKGPSLIECKTYRYGGHHVGEPGTRYRSAEEIEYWKSRDPITLMSERLRKEKVLTPAQSKRIENEVENDVDEAIEFSKNSPFPDPLEATKDILLDP
jgi:pyruvate dehydrogenase E1 component alpha subunit